jgi:hypothetical protein
MTNGDDQYQKLTINIAFVQNKLTIVLHCAIWKFATDIITSIAASPKGRPDILVIMFVENYFITEI